MDFKPRIELFHTKDNIIYPEKYHQNFIDKFDAQDEDVIMEGLLSYF
ncbi:MAG: hypothetical protein SFT90_00580 [Rickettsiales bacterium]|nr:hypothetical protein [Rickettsiales bacterium]